MDEQEPVRLDKWLWAARFFKTRALAKQAIEAGRVRYDGERSKVSRRVDPGATLSAKQGWGEIEVIVRAVSDVRGPASVAQQLYEETPASRERRATEALQRKASRVDMPERRPTKQQRRQIHQFKRSMGD